MNFAVIISVVVLVSVLETSVDATICQPFSKFKIDCDECQCSEDGTEYSCTMRRCGENSKFPPSILDNQNIFHIGHKKSRVHSRNANEIPYINDEIPSSNENIQNEYLEDLVYDEINGKENTGSINNDKEKIQDVSLEEQNASMFDSEIPANYRTKRYIKPNGKRYIYLKPHGKRYIHAKPHGKRYIHAKPHTGGKRYIKPHGP